MRRRIFWGTALVAMITIVIGAVAAAVLIRRSVEESIRSEFARQATATARVIDARFLDGPPARGSDGADVSNQRREIAEILTLVSAVGGHDYVEAGFINDRGQVLELTDAERVLFEQIPEDADLTRPLHFDADVDGQQVAAIMQPFQLDRRGSLVVVIGTELEVIPWGAVFLRFGWAIALAFLLAALMSGAVARRLAARLDPLRDASRDIADGDLAARVDVGGADEITEVARAFNDMAVQLEAARDRERQFLVSVGHDLRTPLTTIAGYAEAMQDGRVDPADLDRIATVLGTEAGRLRRLLEDLMLLSRLEAREFTLRPEQVDLAAHLKGVLEAFRGRAETAKVELAADLDEVGHVWVDPDRVAQIVGNLLENALRYTPEAGRVALELRRVEAGVRVTVADSGPGIEADDLPHIFERLYVTARYRPVRPEGSGLGLTIVRELVDAMGGFAAVDSAPGAGTSIQVTLPV